MIAVAVVAIAFGGWIEHYRYRQRTNYGSLLQHFANEEKENREQAEELARRIPEDPKHFKYWSDYYAREAAYSARQKRQLEREIARLPWEPYPDSEDTDNR
jgi:hypothetical protein